jgi:hypothetical protein
MGPTGSLGSVNITLPNIYGYFNCTLEKDEITDCMLIEFNNIQSAGIFDFIPNSSSIYFRENGLYKISYGVVCLQPTDGCIELLINNEPAHGSKISTLINDGTTNGFLVMNIQKNSYLSLSVSGKAVKLSNKGLNSYILIEKMCDSK